MLFQNNYFNLAETIGITLDIKTGSSIASNLPQIIVIIQILLLFLVVIF